MTLDLDDLVRGLGASTGTERFASYQALVARGAEGLAAIRLALRHPNWQVRQWAAMCLDQVADEEALTALVPLLEDPHPKVRLWAVHSISCEHCKPDVACPVDVVPLLIERVRADQSLRVRRMAVIMLGAEFEDARALPVLERVRREDPDAKIRAHAEAALARLARAGVTRILPAP